ncbi:organelle RRM domain-containing protein 2, mitochondrial [Coffea eugenioides]|uniref:Organelle RRM domain-containing protein 2, mitochondrial-like n=1 Tax=Coffea arabica TaxID=13443 RepID=A0A6P6SW90_COFAR|nr:organelle RRM domain-containing protein 2, mitochondrial-like [Coffea arabica]XP_027175694.1 organelle RRM domain-containing protein 2, mitochondrial [Coffea eugenioides]
MAFASGFRRILSLASSTNSSSSSIRPCLLASTRLQSTLTSPKLFISGLSRTTNDEALNNAFLQFGKLVEAKVITDRATGRSKGFGFVTYETIEEAEKARQEMSGKFLDGWVIFVDPAKPREPRPPPPAQSQGQPSQPGYTVNRTIGWCG